MAASSRKRKKPGETLTEAEFLVSVLKSEDIVDELTLTAIRIQFEHIMRHKRAKMHEARELVRAHALERR